MAPDIHALQTPEFWSQAWEQVRKASPHVRRKIRSDKETMEFWNRIAPTYGKQTSGRSKERVKKIIELLEREKILIPQAAILDVGCGPGTYALPFAEQVTSVTALDGAWEMCGILEHRAKTKRLYNIEVMHHLWKDVDLEREGLAKKFDFVFASMTPAVCDHDTLLKLNRASKKNCCLVSSAGGSCGKARQELWQHIFQEEDSGRGDSLIYIFNLLYSMGCQPSLQYLDSAWVREEPIDRAIERLSHSFWLYTEITPDIKKAITQFVCERAMDGIFRETVENHQGIMIWEVNQ
jgi:SAM-dependent methyltransferase